MPLQGMLAGMNGDAYGFLLTHGGVARRRDLERCGVSGMSIARMVQLGMLIRPRVGWYCLPDVDRRVIEAVRVGGVLTCVSAAAVDGLWVLDEEKLHVCVRGNGSVFRSRTDATRYRAHDERGDVVLHWDDQAWSTSGGYALSRVAYLRHLVSCQSHRSVVSTLDSALHRGVLSDRDLGELRGSVPAVHRSIIDLVDGRAESGVESAARLGFLAAGLPFEVQVVVSEGLRVDFVIDGVIVVEVDGSEFHSGHEAFVADRKRDAFLNALGYRVLHFTYAMVLFDWETVLSTIIIVLRRERAVRAGLSPLPPFRR
ncbi:Very-short-patch-repair endonuclease [Agreia sp. VKM Ac-1783]|nr:Very-short-patch-repair endonuclease [Agreia sp. VKM Ac-1783]